MTEEFLHLLNGHPFANGISGQGAPELMGVDAMHIEALLASGENSHLKSN